MISAPIPHLHPCHPCCEVHLDAICASAARGVAWKKSAASAACAVRAEGEASRQATRLPERILWRRCVYAAPMSPHAAFAPAADAWKLVVEPLVKPTAPPEW